MEILSLAGIARTRNVKPAKLKDYSLTDQNLGRVIVLSVEENTHEARVLETGQILSRGNYGEFYENP